MKPRQPLFLYHNGPRGDVVYSRAVHRALAASGRFDLVLGCCRDDAPLLTDLQDAHCRVVASDFANTPWGAVLDLAALNPDRRPQLEIWLGGAEAVPSYQWADVVESLNRDLQRQGIAFALDAGGDVPMLDFGGDIAVPPLRRPSIWLDNARTVQPLCHFVYDFERLCDVLPDHDLLCTAPVPCAAERLVDVGALSLPQRSRLSEACDVLLGTTMDPFNATLTEANRCKAKALCGYDARQVAPPWDYPGNPLELLATMDDLVDFLLANVAVEARR